MSPKGFGDYLVDSIVSRVGNAVTRRDNALPLVAWEFPPAPEEGSERESGVDAANTAGPSDRTYSEVAKGGGRAGGGAGLSAPARAPSSPPSRTGGSAQKPAGKYDLPEPEDLPYGYVQRVLKL
jgi:hypothetical protein